MAGTGSVIVGAFSAESTTDEVLEGVDLEGRIVAITGASSGLGEESARAMSAKGARVLMLARDLQKNAQAAGRIRMSVPDADLTLCTVDLADLASIESFANTVRTDIDHIDVLLNNAGVMGCPEGRTADGFETQLGTNHLGHFALTARLIPLLLAADRPRVVTLSSGGHRISDVALDDPNFERADYDPWIAYGRSKSANAHFAAELARRHGERLISVSVHPGAIVTNLGRHMTPEMIERLMARRAENEAAGKGGGGLKFKSVEAGAATQVWAATAVEVAGGNGAYLADCGPTIVGPGEKGRMAYLDDAETSTRLWALSEELVGLTFG